MIETCFRLTLQSDRDRTFSILFSGSMIETGRRGGTRHFTPNAFSILFSGSMIETVSRCQRRQNESDLSVSYSPDR